jgi:hypothetical protein
LRTCLQHESILDQPALPSGPPRGFAPKKVYIILYDKKRRWGNSFKTILQHNLVTSQRNEGIEPLED